MGIEPFKPILIQLLHEDYSIIQQKKAHRFAVAKFYNISLPHSFVEPLDAKNFNKNHFISNKAYVVVKIENMSANIEGWFFGKFAPTDKDFIDPMKLFDLLRLEQGMPECVSNKSLVTHYTSAIKETPQCKSYALYRAWKQSI